MAKTHMKRCSVLYVIREMQIKTMRYKYTRCQSSPESGTLEAPNAGEHGVQEELSFTAGGNAKRCSYVGRQFGGFFQN